MEGAASRACVELAQGHYFPTSEGELKEVREALGRRVGGWEEKNLSLGG